MDSRTTWHEYWHMLAAAAATRSTCNRLSVGCVIIRDNRLIATGYNGSPSGEPHCLTVGCDMQDGHCVRSVHAEENAVFNAARYGIALDNTSAYVTHQPCQRCSKALSSAGITAVHFATTYDSEFNDGR